MGKKDPRIDHYIDQAAPFAQPVLKHLRKLVHTGCPAVEETMKWSMPHFDYKGIMCGMAAHKQHCSFGFWQGSELALGGAGKDADGMGQFGRITSLADLPNDETLVGYVRKAVALKDAGVKKPKVPRAKKTPAELEIPEYFTRALRNNLAAHNTFENFSYSGRKEYVEWVAGAMREATREDRLATAIEWLAEGKALHWRYQAKGS